MPRPDRQLYAWRSLFIEDHIQFHSPPSLLTFFQPKYFISNQQWANVLWLYSSPTSSLLNTALLCNAPQASQCQVFLAKSKPLHFYDPSNFFTVLDRLEEALSPTCHSVRNTKGELRPNYDLSIVLSTNNPDTTYTSSSYPMSDSSLYSPASTPTVTHTTTPAPTYAQTYPYINKAAPLVAALNPTSAPPTTETTTALVA